MEEALLPYKDNFKKECNIIDFFVKILNEIKTQIEFYGYICEKDFQLFSHKAERIIKNVGILKKNISSFKDEPSNLYLLENQCLKFLQIYYSTFQKLYPDILTSVKTSIAPIAQNLENAKKNVLNHSVLTLKHCSKNYNKKELNKYLKETIEIIMINAFKGLFNLHQLILIHSKKKNNLYLTIKNTIQEKISSEEVNMVINDVSERKYAEKFKINYEPIHFGNSVYKTLLSDESNDVLQLSKSYLNYTMVFIKCIQIRKKIIKEMRIFTDVLRKKNEDLVLNLKKICEKITLRTKKFIHSSHGIINSWNLIFSSWNSIYTGNRIFQQYLEEVCSSNLTKHIEDCNEEYKKFEKKWEKYADKIKDLRNKYIKYNNKKITKEEDKEKVEEELKEKKKREEKLKNYLTIDCSDFLDNNIPVLRDSELKRLNEVKNLSEKFKTNIKKKLEEYLENTENEYDNAAQIDIFEEIRIMFENQLESLEINDMETYMENLKNKITSIDFNDDLAESARKSLAEYYDHNNDFDDGLDLSGDNIENPFNGNIIKYNDIESSNLEDKELMLDKIGQFKDDELSSIKKSKKSLNELNNIKEVNNEYKTPSFNDINSSEKNKINSNNDNQQNIDEFNIANNLNNRFTMGAIINDDNNNINNNFNEKINQIKDLNMKKKRRISIHDSKKNIENLAGNTLCSLRGGNIDINDEIDNVNDVSNNNLEKNEQVESDDSFPSINDNQNINDNEINALSPIKSNKLKNTKKMNHLYLNEEDIINEKEELENFGIEDKKINKESEGNHTNSGIKNINNINNKYKGQDNQTLYYGILCILGLFCLKSLFSTNTFFSADSFLNVVIIGFIGFIMYKTQFKK